MTKILDEDLNRVLDILQGITLNTQDFSYDKTKGGYKLVRYEENGAWIVSPHRLGKWEMHDWMLAYIHGIEDGKKILKRSELDRMLEKMGASK
jgi:hypothetical protein